MCAGYALLYIQQYVCTFVKTEILTWSDERGSILGRSSGLIGRAAAVVVVVAAVGVVLHVVLLAVVMRVVVRVMMRVIVIVVGWWAR